MLDDADGLPLRSLDDYWVIVRRRRWFIILPLFGCWAVAWLGSWLVPSTFQSEALILVEQQKVPEQYVLPNISVSLQDRLQSMTQQILSRTRLESTISRFHLYERPQRIPVQTDDPVEQMRRDIRIELVEAPDKPGQLTAFRIRYSAATPQMAQQVNSELTSLFIEENLKSQEQLSESTTAFLQSQLTDARTKLEEQEAKVRAFKASHFGNLPSQVEANVQILSGLQAQLLNIQHALDEANQHKLYLESLQQQYQSIQASLGNGNSIGTSPDMLDKELMNLRRQLEESRSKYTEDHPDVVQLRDKIAKTEKLKQNIDAQVAINQNSGKPANEIDPAAATSVEHGSASPMMQIQSQLQANRLEIQNYREREKQIESDIRTYQARLNLTPITEQELADVSRGYEESKAHYSSLLQKQNDSQLATSLEHRQQGEQFRILDPPSLPSRPSAPNHIMLSLAGLVVGLIAGIGLAALLEMTDIRIRQEKDLDDVVSINMLVGIPHLYIPGEDRTRALLKRVELAAMAAIAILIVTGSFYAFYKS